MSEAGVYYGKHRGTVANNIDPEFLGRLQAIVPGVPGLDIVPTTWAYPSVPLAGKQRGTYVVPEIGAGVWIEFEQGDPRRPVWTGCFWGTAAEVPAEAQMGLPVLPSIVLSTTPKNTLVISEVPGPTGGIMIRSGLASITINETGIIIQNGQGASLQLTGPSVIVNNGALTVL
jgi:hypothetical protein